SETKSSAAASRTSSRAAASDTITATASKKIEGPPASRRSAWSIVPRADVEIDRVGLVGIPMGRLDGHDRLAGLCRIYRDEGEIAPATVAGLPARLLPPGLPD